MEVKMSNKSSESGSSGGVSFFGLLGIVFIVLKLTGFIDWPWLYVLAPLWAPLALILTILLGILIFVIFKHWMKK
jgi:hypothetical protein